MSIEIPLRVKLFGVSDTNAIKYFIPSKNGETLTKEINTQKLTDDVLMCNRFIAPVINQHDREQMNFKTTIYCYRNGVYKPIGVEIIKKFCYDALKQCVEKPHFDKIIDYITTYNRIPEEKVNKQGIITLTDCNYDFTLGDIIPHTPEIFNTFCIPVKWNGIKSDTKPFDDFLEKVLLPEEIEAMWELIGYCMAYKDMSIRELFIFYGSQTACGKTVCANVITALLGSDNTNNATLSDLVKKQFSGSMIVGKMINVCPEEPPGKLPTSRIKSWTGQDRTNSEKKGENECANFTTVKFIVLSNHLPEFQTDEESIFNRINVLHFPHSFKTVEDKKLTESLTSPEVLSGIAKRAVKAYQNLIKRGRFSNWKPEEKRERIINTVSNSLRVFADIYCVNGDYEDTLTKHEFHNKYANWCERIGREAHIRSKIDCGKALPKMVHYIDDRQRSIYDNDGGKSTERVWAFVKWRDELEAEEETRELMQSMGKVYVAPSVNKDTPSGAEQKKLDVGKSQQEKIMSIRNTLLVNKNGITISELKATTGIPEIEPIIKKLGQTGQIEVTGEIVKWV